MDATSEMFQLDRATCLTLLTTQHVGRLAMGGEDPVVMPVNYVVDGRQILFRTERDGRAGRSVGERVMFEVDMVDERTRSGWSVLVHGTLEELPDGAALPVVVTWAPGDRDRWMAVGLDLVTGRLLRGAVDVSSVRADGYL